MLLWTAPVLNIVWYGDRSLARSETRYAFHVSVLSAARIAASHAADTGSNPVGSTSFFYYENSGAIDGNNADFEKDLKAPFWHLSFISMFQNMPEKMSEPQDI